MDVDFVMVDQCDKDGVLEKPAVKESSGRLVKRRLVKKSMMCLDSSNDLNLADNLRECPPSKRICIELDDWPDAENTESHTSRLMMESLNNYGGAVRLQSQVKNNESMKPSENLTPKVPVDPPAKASHFAMQLHSQEENTNFIKPFEKSIPKVSVDSPPKKARLSETNNNRGDQHDLSEKVSVKESNERLVRRRLVKKEVSSIKGFDSVNFANGLKGCDETERNNPFSRHILENGNCTSRTDVQKTSYNTLGTVSKSLKEKSFSSVDQKMEECAVSPAAEGRQFVPQMSMKGILHEKMKNDKDFQLVGNGKSFVLGGNEHTDSFHSGCNAVPMKQRIAHSGSVSNNVKEKESTDQQALLKQLVHNRGSCKKRYKVSDVKGLPQLGPETRILLSSGCEDLASDHEPFSENFMSKDFVRKPVCGRRFKDDMLHTSCNVQLVGKQPRTSASIMDKSRTVKQAAVIEQGECTKLHNPCISEKGDSLSDLADVTQIVSEARTMMPSGCKDLASGHQSVSQDLTGNDVEWKRLSDVSSKDGKLHTNCKIQLPRRPIRTSSSIIDNSRTCRQAVESELGESTKLQNVQENPSLFKAELLKKERSEVGAGGHLQRIMTEEKRSCRMVPERAVSVTQRDETCKEMQSVTEDIGQEAACRKSEVEKVSEDKNRKQDYTPGDLQRSLLERLEISLKAGDCDLALLVFTAWKNDAFGVGITKTLERSSLLEGEGADKHAKLPDIPGKRKGFVVSFDISRGLEKMAISCVNEYNSEVLPEDFRYITRSVIAAAAYVDTSFSRIGDLHCGCSDDCLRSSQACKCTDSTRGEYAYDENGCLIPRLAMSFHSKHATKNGDFITECCAKCQCSMTCGNRVVQRGITIKLQIFMTRNKKGWGVRALETISAGSFVFEYIGEIATNHEQYYRNIDHEKKGVHTYTMNLDADFDMEERHFGEGLTDSEALVLDATNFGNVSRFLNHRCNDANLFVRPVQIETRDTHYYHAALFAARDIKAMEELTWDYGIDFSDDLHAVKAFKCRCSSPFCRDKAEKKKASKPLL